MTILAAGSEPEAFNIYGSSWDMQTSSNYIDTNYSRAGVKLREYTQIVVDFEEQTDTVYASFMLGIVSTQSSNGQTVAALLGLASGVYNRLVRIRASNTSSAFVFEYWDGSAYVSLGGFTATQNVAYRITLAVKLHATAGWVRFYRNGVLEGEAVDINTLTISGLSSLSRLALGALYIASNSTGFGAVYSEVIVANENTVDMRLKTLAPNAAGTYSEWTSGDYTGVDETGMDDTDFIMSNTAAQRITFNFPDISIADFKVHSVVLSARARAGDTGPQNMEALVRSGGTDAEVPFSAPEFNYTPNQVIMAVNPVGGTAWTQASLNAAEIGLRSVA